MTSITGENGNECVTLKDENMARHRLTNRGNIFKGGRNISTDISPDKRRSFFVAFHIAPCHEANSNELLHLTYSLTVLLYMQHLQVHTVKLLC